MLCNMFYNKRGAFDFLLIVTQITSFCLSGRALKLLTR